MRKLTSTQRAEATAALRRILEEIENERVYAADVERAYLEGVLRGLDGTVESPIHT